MANGIREVEIQTRDGDVWSAEATIILELDDLAQTTQRMTDLITKHGFRTGSVIHIEMKNLSAYASGAHMREPYRSHFTERMQRFEKERQIELS